MPGHNTQKAGRTHHLPKTHDYAFKTRIKLHESNNGNAKRYDLLRLYKFEFINQPVWICNAAGRNYGY